MKQEYIDNPKLHLKHLLEFADRLRTKHILGEDDKEYRKELEFILQRTEQKIEIVRGIIFLKGIDLDDGDR